MLSIVHSMTKGSYLLRENEFTNACKRADIVLLNQDFDFIASFFRQNAKKGVVDLR